MLISNIFLHLQANRNILFIYCQVLQNSKLVFAMQHDFLYEECHIKCTLLLWMKLLFFAVISLKFQILSILMLPILQNLRKYTQYIELLTQSKLLIIVVVETIQKKVFINVPCYSYGNQIFCFFQLILQKKTANLVLIITSTQKQLFRLLNCDFTSNSSTFSSLWKINLM